MGSCSYYGCVRQIDRGKIRKESKCDVVAPPRVLIPRSGADKRIETGSIAGIVEAVLSSGTASNERVSFLSRVILSCLCTEKRIAGTLRVSGTGDASEKGIAVVGGLVSGV